MRARTEPASCASASTASAVTATKRPSHGRTTASSLLSRSKRPAPASSGPSATLVTTSRTDRPWHGTSAVSTYVAGEKPAPWRAETKTVQAPGSSVSAARRRTGMNSSVSGMSSSASGRCGPPPACGTPSSPALPETVVVEGNRCSSRAVTTRPGAQTTPLRPSIRRRTTERSASLATAVKNSCIASSDRRCVMRVSRLSSAWDGGATSGSSARGAGRNSAPSTRIAPAAPARTTM